LILIYLFLCYLLILYSKNILTKYKYIKRCIQKNLIMIYVFIFYFLYYSNNLSAYISVLDDDLISEDIDDDLPSKRSVSKLIIVIKN
jgi:hypothetical protein